MDVSTAREEWPRVSWDESGPLAGLARLETLHASSWPGCRTSEVT